MRLLFAAFAASLAVSISVAFAASSTLDGAVSSVRTRTAQPRHTVALAFDGLNIAVQADRDRQTFLVASLHALKARQDAARAQVAAQVRTASTGASGASTGACSTMKPPGFPDYIISRESGGDPNAVNRSSGAAGCAQIMPMHWRTGGSCYGLDYASCWAKLWAGGAGASHWACTRESGCAG